MCIFQDFERMDALVKPTWTCLWRPEKYIRNESEGAYKQTEAAQSGFDLP